jgi:Arc/MetJ-type ribon-helix-helix transcriptional regulator
MDTARSEGHVIGSKVSAIELEEIKKLVASGVYLNTSDFVRDAVRNKLAAIKTIKYRDVDYVTAKKEVMGYFQDRGEAYPSEARKISDPHVIAKSGRHKAQRVILTENAEAIIERKLGWIPEQ